MLDGLAAAGGGAEGDGAGDEDDELAGGGSLEVAEVADVGGVGQHDGLLLPTSGGGGGIAGGFEHQQRRDLHGGIRPEGRQEKGSRWGGVGIGIGCRRCAEACGELRIGKGTPAPTRTRWWTGGGGGGGGNQSRVANTMRFGREEAAPVVGRRRVTCTRF